MRAILNSVVRDSLSEGDFVQRREGVEEESYGIFWEKMILSRENISEQAIPEARTHLMCLRKRKEVTEGM